MNRVSIIMCALILNNAYLCTRAEQPITLYCHGLGGSLHEVYGLVTENVIQYPVQAVAFKKENDCGLGQGMDIETLKNKISNDAAYILYGISRGGATAINYLADYNPDNIVALIVDATPADIMNIVDEIQYKIGIFALWTRAQKEWAVRLIFPHYPAETIPPVQAIAHITNKNLPVFIVHSHNDPIVNIRSAWHLYQAFQQADFTNVYLCELQEGRHMSNASGPDSIIYKQALHSFYKKHDLQFDVQYATLTDDQLRHFQPSSNEIELKLFENQHQLRKKGLINLGIYTTIQHYFL